VEDFTVFSHMLHRGVVEFLRHLGPAPAPSRGASRNAARARFDGQLAALDQAGEPAVVLRMLIEEFGGEVVSSALGQRLVEKVRWQWAGSDLWLRGILNDLEQCGALTLEAVNRTEVIARVLPAGVILAYNLCPPRGMRMTQMCLPDVRD
jgi:hypothetical protein